MGASAKIKKPGGAEADEVEQSISQAIFELEMNSDLKASLRELYITGAKELEIAQKDDHNLCPSSAIENVSEDPSETGTRTGKEILWQTCCRYRSEENLAQTITKITKPEAG